MEIRTFDKSYLQGTKDALRSAFFHENSHELYNEWGIRRNCFEIRRICVGFMCDCFGWGETVVGYNALTKARIGDQTGLALGPLGVRKEYQNTGVGSALVKECIRRAGKSGYPWIALLGGDYYLRFGFEHAAGYGITVSDNEFDNEHLQILFLKESAKGRISGISGKLVYCDVFYDEKGNLL